MKIKVIIIILIFNILAYKITFSSPYDDKFPVFNALSYKNMPDLAEHGLFPIKVIYESELWGEGEDMSEPNLNRIRVSAENAKKNELVCIDIEHWDVQGSETTVRNSIEKFLTIARSFKEINSSSALGFYMVLPIRDYWRAIFPNKVDSYNEWIDENAALMPIAGSVDAVFPSLYTFYDDPKTWKKYAIENIKEARKYGKPVYAFLWPRYHNSSTLRGEYISQQFWKLQLETCFQYADGIVLWGGKDEQWNEKAPWWIEVKRFNKWPDTGRIIDNLPYYFLLNRVDQ